MRLLPTLAAVSCLACSSTPAPAPPSARALVLRNARVFTAADAPRWADAVAILGERVLAVGAAEAVEREARARASSVQVIDAGGRVVVPGFNDAHFHGGTYPEFPKLDAGGREPTFDAVVGALGAAAAAHPPGTWLVVEAGGTTFSDPRAVRATLDGITGRHPVAVQNWGGHTSVLNSAALAALGFDDRSPTPPGGKLGRGADGRLDGRLEEYANYLAGRRLAALTPREAQRASYEKAARRFATRGLTSVQDMSGIVPAGEAAALLEGVRLPVRWRLIRFPISAEGALDLSADRAAKHRGSKFILDGTPIERGAAMTAPYADAGGRGALNFTLEEVKAMLLASESAGDQPMFHAVGDAAIGQVLDALDATGGAARWKARRVRIEHADLITPEQAARCRELGVVVVQNPSHHMLGDMMLARYGANGGRPIQPMRSLLAAGVPLALGSDGPSNPFLNLLFATTHAVTPAEALTREEAVVAYTRGSAYAEHAEHEKGTLAPGMLADLAVLSQDPFTAAPEALPKTTSVLTLVGGEVVHDAGVVAR